MDGWERFNETLLPTKEEFYTNLTTGSIKDTDYKHSKGVWENFELQHLCQYHNLRV